jgi:adenine-specific DNA-methyltransferase
MPRKTAVNPGDKPRKPRAPKAASSEAPVKDYRHGKATRLNNPPAGLTGQQPTEVAERAQTVYDPHKPPVLRFDATGAADKITELLAEAQTRKLTREEIAFLESALAQHQPWLEWSGKAQQSRVAIDDVALHMHERVSAQAILKAVQRDDIQKGLFADPELPVHEALKFYQHSVDWANRLILGDSLLVMNSLVTREHLRGKVQMIYMDPPYGIKFASNFQPFINQRDVKDREEDLTREPEMIRAYRDTWEKGVHTYLAYLRDRLVLCRELLGETGSIFVQISDENVHRVRDVMDDVFGAGNFVRLISYRTSSPLGAGMVPSTCNYLLWYAKDIHQAKFRRLFLPQSVTEDTHMNHCLLPDGGYRALTDAEKSDPSLLPPGHRVFRFSPMSSSGYTPSCTFPFVFEGATYSLRGGKSWRTNIDGMERLAAVGRLLSTNTYLNFVQLFDDFPYMDLSNLWTDSHAEQGKIYVVQTSALIVQRCLLMTTDPGDLVLDPTCGSGTTAFVSEEWGRRWITIDTSRVAIALARQRLMTRPFPMYQTTDSGTDPSRNFAYKTAPHIRLESISRNPRLDPDKVKGKSREQIEQIIREGVEQETLYDQPEVVRNVTRVSGPFSVEAIPAPILSPDSPITGELESLPVDDDAGDGRHEVVANAGAYTDNLISLLRQDGITFPGGKKLMVPDLASRAGQFLHAEGHTGVNGGEQFVTVSFGPQYGPVTVQQVEQAMRQANRAGFDLLVFAGFAFEAAATAAIDDPAEREVKVLWTQIRPDLLMQDEEGNSLLKTTASSQLFTAFGEPDADLFPADDGWTVTINGVDIYDPVTGVVASAPIEKVAAWFLDTDYDGRTFCICQAFFPQTTAWDKLARALKGTVDLEKLEKYKGHVSLPFSPGKHRAVAVKVIDLRGNEVMRVLRFPEEKA